MTKTIVADGCVAIQLLVREVPIQNQARIPAILTTIIRGFPQPSNPCQANAGKMPKIKSDCYLPYIFQFNIH
jgi:hypothetical protein